MMRNDSIQGFDIHDEDEFMCARKMNVLMECFDGGVMEMRFLAV